MIYNDIYNYMYIFTVGVISVTRGKFGKFKASVDESGPRRAGSHGLTDEAGQIQSEFSERSSHLKETASYLNCLGYPGFVDIDSGHPPFGSTGDLARQIRDCKAVCTGVRHICSTTVTEGQS